MIQPGNIPKKIENIFPHKNLYSILMFLALKFIEAKEKRQLEGLQLVNE